MMMADNVRNAKMDSNFIPIALVKSFQLILACGCDTQGSVSNGTTCTNDGQCKCKPKMEGLTCNRCKDGFYDFPKCKGNSKSQSLLFFNWFIFQKLVSVMTKEERITFVTGDCDCENYIKGTLCDECIENHCDFLTCKACHCDKKWSKNQACNVDSGDCARLFAQCLWSKMWQMSTSLLSGSISGLQRFLNFFKKLKVLYQFWF